MPTAFPGITHTESITYIKSISVEKTSGIKAIYFDPDPQCELAGEEGCCDGNTVPSIACCPLQGPWPSELTVDFSNGTGCLTALNGKSVTLYYYQPDPDNPLLRMWTSCLDYKETGSNTCIDQEDAPCYDTTVCPSVSLCFRFILNCEGTINGIPFIGWNLFVYNANIGAIFSSSTQGTNHSPASVFPNCEDIPDPLFFQATFDTPLGGQFFGCGGSGLCAGTIDFTIHE